MRYALDDGQRSAGIWMTALSRSTTMPLNVPSAASHWAARTGCSQDRTPAVSAPPPSTRSSEPAS